MTVVRWNPNAVYGPLHRALALALIETAALANSRGKAAWHFDPGVKVIPKGENTAILKPSNRLANIFEGGAKPHLISPNKHAALVLRGTRPQEFASGPVHHPGIGAKPILHESARAFPGIFARIARTQFGVGLAARDVRLG